MYFLLFIALRARTWMFAAAFATIALLIAWRRRRWSLRLAMGQFRRLRRWGR